MAIVLDASALVDYLIRNRVGEWVEQYLAADTDIRAPHLIDVEAAHAFRGLVLRGLLEPARAREALAEVGLVRIARYPHTSFLDTIWALRVNLSAYDAAYVALADALGAPLVSTDERLGRAPGLPIDVITPW